MTSSRNLGFALLGATLALAVSVAPAMAQGRRGRGFGPPRGLRLLENKSVQDELKITQAQIDKIQAKSQDIQQARRDAFQSAGQDQSARQEAMAKVQQQENEAVNSILDSGQQKRFHEVELQVEGPNALARAEIQTAVGLTDEQKNQIKEMQAKQREEAQAARQGVDFQNMSQEERQQFFQKQQDAQKAFGEKLVALLTADQKAKWTAMQGAPFKYVPTPAAGA